MLEKENYKTQSAYNGFDAIEHLKGGANFELILLDWNMPEMNGPDFLKTIQGQDFIKTPIVMMTTENSIDKITEAMELGVNEYIMKPFTDDILISKIDFVLNSKAA